MKKGHSIKDRILQAVMTAEVSRGHLKWKVSELARLTKVSRPLIYYHFGKTKKDILAECLKLVAEDYFGLTPERQNSLVDGTILESIRRTRKLYSLNPSLAVFYQKARMQNNELNDQLKQIEQRYQKKLKKSLPHLNDVEVAGVHALFHGLVTAPFLSDESLAAAVKMINFSGAEK